MAIQLNFIIFTLILSFTFNITEFECRNISQRGTLNQTWLEASQIITEYPLGISEVFDDAGGVFRKVLGKIVSTKKLLGIESFYFK